MLFKLLSGFTAELEFRPILLHNIRESFSQRFILKRIGRLLRQNPLSQEGQDFSAEPLSAAFFFQDGGGHCWRNGRKFFMMTIFSVGKKEFWEFPLALEEI